MQTKLVQQPSETHSWSGLSTVTTFDAGSTARVGMAENGLVLQEMNCFSPISLLVQSLVEQLCKMIEHNPKHQKKLYSAICRKLNEINLIDQTYDVEEFEFMRSHYQRALFNLLTVAKSVTSVGPDDTKASLHFPPRYNFNMSGTLLASDWSRYSTEYEELEYIARGGFGRVYKVRNKLDGMVYAIKKICLQYRNISGFLRNLREVKMLAKLNHPNIVSYKAAWLEPLSTDTCRRVADDSNDNVVKLSLRTVPSRNADRQTKDDDSSSIVFRNSKAEDMATKSSGDSISVFTENNTDEQLHVSAVSYEDKSFYRHVEHSQNENGGCTGNRPSMQERTYHRKRVTHIKNTNESTSTTEDSEMDNLSYHTKRLVKSDKTFSESTTDYSNKMLCKYRRSSKRVFNWKIDNSIVHHEWAMLYVQMQLCEKTLRQWLDARNAQDPVTVDVKQSVAIFQQIVHGVCYIHSQSIVHHDIKPSNIFVNSNLSQVQVGDFGLACCLQHSTQDVTLLRQSSSDHLLKHKGEIGTKLYAAPEQRKGKCDSKSDIYSLGIVLFELLQPFSTDMERCKLITQLKADHTSPSLTIVAPKLVRLITHLLSPCPEERPSAEELQTMLEPLLNETSKCCDTAESKDRIIEELRSVISERDREIEVLRQRLRELESREVTSALG